MEAVWGVKAGEGAPETEVSALIHTWREPHTLPSLPGLAALDLGSQGWLCVDSMWQLDISATFVSGFPLLVFYLSRSLPTWDDGEKCGSKKTVSPTADTPPCQKQPCRPQGKLLTLPVHLCGPWALIHLTKIISLLFFKSVN